MDINEEQYIKKEDLEDFCLYSCNARNFNVGIWYKNEMYGLRHKFGDSYIDSENHWDDGPENYGTCKPLKKISYSLKNRLSDFDFNKRNWRSQIVLHDMLFAIESCIQFKENEDNL